MRKFERIHADFNAPRNVVASAALREKVAAVAEAESPLDSHLFDVAGFLAAEFRDNDGGSGGAGDERALLAAVVEGALAQLDSLVDGGRVERGGAAARELEGSLERLRQALRK